MPETWIDVRQLQLNLTRFFSASRDEVSRFGSTVNQTFEAFVFAATLQWYRDRGWTVTVVHPDGTKDGKGIILLKFSTRGRPVRYSYGECRRDSIAVQVRHQLRVQTHWDGNGNTRPANVCLDVAVLEDTNLSAFTTDTALPNRNLVTFGEAKHMSAFAELIAGFIGLVHELQPSRLEAVRSRPLLSHSPHPAPFLYVSGYLYKTAQGLCETIEKRGYDLDVYTETHGLTARFALPKTPAVKAVKAPPKGSVPTAAHSDMAPGAPRLGPARRKRNRRQTYGAR